MSVISLDKPPTTIYRLPCWSQLEALFGEWWQRIIISRYELESLSERDLADMGMTLSMLSTKFRSLFGRSNSAPRPVRLTSWPVHASATALRLTLVVRCLATPHAFPCERAYPLRVKRRAN